MEATEKKPSTNMAVREITITANGWAEHQPKSKRSGIMKMIFSLANEFGWSVRVSGQPWIGLTA